MSQVLATVKRSQNGKIAWMRQTLEMQKKTESVDGDNNGFVNIPLAAKEVEAVCYMRETQPNAYRVSLRSKDNINVARVAEKFGGGGHKNASGCRVEGDWNNKESEIIAALTEAIEKANDTFVEGEKSNASFR
jgi:phosphoesterase RecJ-like protein